MIAGEWQAKPCGMLLSAFLLAALSSSAGQAPTPSPCVQAASPSTDLFTTEAMVQTLRGASFPELASVDLRLRTFQSRADYFRTRLSIPRFLSLQRMRYFVEVNSALFRQKPPSEGVCAILAHELSHAVALSHGNRIRRLSLIRLLSKSYTAQFERKTDLEAIRRGYADGLKSYRAWVYAHIPAKSLAAKQRNYFSPEEIEKIQERLRTRPDILSYWSRHAPRNLQEIMEDPK